MLTRDDTSDLAGNLAGDQLSSAVNEALSLTAECLGLRAAVEARSQFRALGSASAGRVVVLGEQDQGGVELILDLLEFPGLATVLAGLPRVNTTYRFAQEPCLVLCTTEQELTVALDQNGACPDVALACADLRGQMLQIEICVPSSFLSWFAVTHVADLHLRKPVDDPLLGLTPDSTVVFVTSGAMPLSAIEVRCIAEAARRATRVSVVLSRPDRYACWREVGTVDEALIAAGGASAAVLEPEELARWLLPTRSSGGALSDAVALVATLARALQVETQRTSPARDRDQVAADLAQAEAQVALVSREAMTWLPRLSHEFSRLRSEAGEMVAHALARLEQRYDQWVQSDIGDATERLAGALLEELRALESRADHELTARIDAVADQFLAGCTEELLSGGVRDHVALPEVHVALVGVAQVHSDRRNELFASLGNFGSGRQSLGLVSSVATAAAVPAALVGGVVGMGLLRLGRSTRQDSLARVQAGRWLKAQLNEAARLLRYRADQVLNDAQLVLNLAVRDYHERLGAEARKSVEASRHRLAEVDVIKAQEAERAAVRVSRALHLQEITRDAGGSHE